MESIQVAQGARFAVVEKSLGVVFGVAVGLFLWKGIWPSFYLKLAALSFILMVFGLFFRRQKSLHVPLMLASMALDLGLVLVLEFQRSAVATALFHGLKWAQYAHITASTFAVVLYFPILYLGIKRFKQTASRSQSQWHYRLGVAAFFFRFLGFLFMSSMTGLH